MAVKVCRAEPAAQTEKWAKGVELYWNSAVRLSCNSVHSLEVEVERYVVLNRLDPDNNTFQVVHCLMLHFVTVHSTSTESVHDKRL